MNQHIKLKHPEYYQQMSVANPSLVGAGDGVGNDSKRGGSVNGRRHGGDDTFGDRSEVSDQSDDEE